MNVLSVDDSSTMRKIIALALQGGGHTVVEAEDGKDALAKGSGGKFDCIILDINMPNMNGIEFLKARKAEPSLAKVPVIMLTTQDEEALRQEALSLGAKNYLVKPFQKDQILEALAKATA